MATYADSSTMPVSNRVRSRLALALMGQGMSAAPVRHWTQGASRLAQALVGGLALNKLGQEERTEREGMSNLALALLGPSAPAMTPVSTGSAGTGRSRIADALTGRGPVTNALSGPAPAIAGGPGEFGPTGADATPGAASIGRFGEAIAGIESGGRYDALGPVTRTGDRAYGKYQIMGANIGPWTERWLGRRMSPQEFLANPQAQDAVFRGQFGEYVNKYGPEGAAAAWFAGEGGMNDPGRRDVLGTSVADYRGRFSEALGDGPPSAAAPMPSMGTGVTPQMREAIARLAQTNPSAALQLAIKLRTANAPKPTDDIREYMLARQQGETRSFTEWDAARRRAGATTINTAPKLPAGYAWVDPNDPGKGVQAIPGGPATKMPAETAGRVALMRTARTSVAEARKVYERDWGVGEWAQSMAANVPGIGDVGFASGEVGRAQRSIRVAIESALRSMTGAAAPESEVRQYMTMFAPGVTDTLDSAKQKLDLLEGFMNRAEAIITQGRGAAPAAPTAPRPGAVEDGYRFKGGDPGNPANWERVQ